MFSGSRWQYKHQQTVYSIESVCFEHYPAKKLCLTMGYWQEPVGSAVAAICQFEYKLTQQPAICLRRPWFSMFRSNSPAFRMTKLVVDVNNCDKDAAPTDPTQSWLFTSFRFRTKEIKGIGWSGIVPNKLFHFQFESQIIWKKNAAETLKVSLPNQM